MRNSDDEEKEQSLNVTLLAIDSLVEKINKKPQFIPYYSILHETVASSLDLLVEKEETNAKEGKQTLGKLGKSYFVAYLKTEDTENLCISDIRNHPENILVKEYSVGKMNKTLGYVELRIRNTKTNKTETLYQEGLPNEEEF